jgi:hypothetical protein
MRFALTLVSILQMGLAHAYFNGSPEIPEMIDEGFFYSKENPFSLRLGYQRDYTFNAKMKPNSIYNSNFNEFNSLMDQGVVTFTLFDLYEAYAGLGAVDFNIQQQLPNSGIVNYITNQEFTFGVGGRFIIFQYDAFVFGVNGNYQYASPKVTSIVKNGMPLLTQDDSRILVHGWQIGLSAAYHVDIFSPYIGVKYLYEVAHFENIPSGVVSTFDTDFKATNRNPVGLFLGVLISSGRNFSVGIESRMIDESAATLTLDLKF